MRLLLMYIFNMLLFKTILENKKTNIRSVAMKSGIPYNTLRNWSVDYRRITAYGIVCICNALKISISSLITNEESDVQSSCLDIFIADNKFQPLFYDVNAVGNIYKRGGWINITKKGFLEKMGVYERTVDNWQRSEKSLKLHTLIDICNKFELNINRFIIDHNRAAVPPTKINSRNAVSMFNQMKDELKNLQFDNLQKGKLINSLQKELDEQKEENDMLRKTYLLRRKTYPEQGVTRSIASDGITSYGLSNTFDIPKRTKYVFNKFLFKSLPMLSGISIDMMSSLCKLSPVYIEEGSDEFRFSRLVALCNKLHISIRHFFLLEGELYMVGRPEEYFSDANLFHRISYLSENVASLSGNDGVLAVNRAHFCDTIGISQSTLSQWIKEERQSTLTVNGVLRICNAFHLSPDIFFEDMNPITMRSYPINAEDMLFTENLLLKKLLKERERELDNFKKGNN